MAAEQLGSEAAKRNCHCEAKSCMDIVLISEFDKLFSLSTKWKLFPLAPPGRESSRLNAVNYGYERGVQRHKNTDRATECAMTNIGANFLKIARHSVDNNILSPKNLIKALQEDLSLSAQDDEGVEMLEPSPAFVAFALAH